MLAGNYFIDQQIKSLPDNRYGLTLIIRVSDFIREQIALFIGELKAIDPAQYYYPDTDLHTTVLSIISCYDGFSMENISVPDYISVIEKSVAIIPPFDIDFRGVTASTSAILIQGFPDGAALNDLRNNLRKNFKSSGLQERIDQRYSIFAAHITIARFSQEIKDAHQLVRFLEKNRHHDFGKMKVENPELVYNDWYHRQATVKQLGSFHLK
ncbi:MAG TPA: hypothetical protein PLD84_00255 [Chitinophagales bacterium]|nr:hypothetical protein [Chitinophagales bacterium]